MDVSVPPVDPAVSVRASPGELVLVYFGDIVSQWSEDGEGTGVAFAKSAVLVEDELTSLREIEVAAEESGEGR